MSCNSNSELIFFALFSQFRRNAQSFLLVYFFLTNIFLTVLSFFGSSRVSNTLQVTSKNNFNLKLIMYLHNAVSPFFPMHPAGLELPTNPWCRIRLSQCINDNIGSCFKYGYIFDSKFQRVDKASHVCLLQRY